MKNPFKRKKLAPIPEQAIEATSAPVIEAPKPQVAPQKSEPQKPDDGFLEWYRTPTRGGIERRERNDFFEEYNVYGTDREGALICRRYHRYPEHEREFDLSYSRALRFSEFNRRLLSELDRGGMKLGDYRKCIEKAEQLSGIESDSSFEILSEKDTALLEAFCNAFDTMKGQTFLHSEGALSCECESVVGDEALQIRFRKPLRHDAINEEIGGVTRKPIEGYDIENLWIMSVYNRLREKCAACKVSLLTYEWSAAKQTVHILIAEGFEGIGGTLMIAVGSPEDMSRFGFWSLDFSGK